jgi:ribonuclease HI
MMAASGNNPTKNPKTRKRKRNVTLCWLPTHAGITETEEVDKKAKRAHEESISSDDKYPPEDLSG